MSIEPSAIERVSPARWAAFRVLERVSKSEDHADDLLHGPLLRGLSEADTSLAHALVMGVLRWQLALEAELLPMLVHPERELPKGVATALRMGAFQLRHMDRIPAHAALNESVALVKLAGQPQAAGMVNALLRKLTRADAAARRKPIGESVAAMAERLGHPEWMVERWVKRYGRAAAEAVCGYDLREPAQATLFADNAVTMDDGSRLIAEVAVAAMPDAKRVWDACAAPGGKTMVLAERLGGGARPGGVEGGVEGGGIEGGVAGGVAGGIEGDVEGGEGRGAGGAEIVATDVHAKRLAGMQERIDRVMPGRVRTKVADATRADAVEGEFDLVLCDAPCSGTGTLARNPEIKVRLVQEDLARQSQRQAAIVIAALKHLRVGGRLVYSTCSLEPEENEQVVEAVLSAAPDVRVVPVLPLLEALVGSGRMVASDDAWVRGEFLRTLPGANFAGDGFFAAVLERMG